MLDRTATSATKPLDTQKASLIGIKPTPKISTSLGDAKGKLKTTKQEVASHKSSHGSISARETPFTSEDLLAACTKCASKYRESGAHTIAQIIDKGKVDSNKVTFSNSNPAVKIKFEQAKTDILQHLRDQLANDSIELEFDLLQESSQGRKAFTAEEKYKEVVEKYPLVEKLRQMLDLTLEY